MITMMMRNAPTILSKWEHEDGKGKLTNSHVIPQELPEPDDIAIAHVNNPQAELLRWHYRLHYLSFGVLQTFV